MEDQVIRSAPERFDITGFQVLWFPSSLLCETCSAMSAL